MPATTDLFNRRISFERCTLHQIPGHFEKIKEWVPENEWYEMKERMADAIEDDGAWCTENTFLYFTRENRRMAHGVALFGKGYPAELLGLIQGIFAKYEHDICMMRFKLHPGKGIGEYLGLLTRSSVQRWHADKSRPVMVRIDELRKRISKEIYQARQK